MDNLRLKETLKIKIETKTEVERDFYWSYPSIKYNFNEKEEYRIDIFKVDD